MSEHERIRFTVASTGLKQRTAWLGGIASTRRHLDNIGAHGGLAWLPHVRSRLYGEMLLQARRGTLANTVGNVTLIGSLSQSFAADVPTAWQRLTKGSSSLPGFAKDLAYRAAMPPVMKSLVTMRRAAGILNDPQLFGTLYTEELPPGERYTHRLAPYNRVEQITPEVAQHHHANVRRLPIVLARRGIMALSFSTYHTARRAASGYMLPRDDMYLPQFVKEGRIRQFSISLNRTDLPLTTGEEAMAETHRLAEALSRPHADPATFGDMSRQLGVVLEHQPSDTPLDITVTGDLQTVPLPTVFENLRTFAERG